MCREAVEALAPLALYADDVRNAVLTDLGYSRLHPYPDQIMASTRALPIQEGLRVESLKSTRPPTRHIEHYEIWLYKSSSTRSFEGYEYSPHIESRKHSESTPSKSTYKA